MEFQIRHQIFTGCGSSPVRIKLKQHVRPKDYYESLANPVDIVCSVVAGGVRRGELRPLDAMPAAALVMGPVIQAATFRTYGRLTGTLSEVADEIVSGIWAAFAKPGD